MDTEKQLATQEPPQEIQVRRIESEEKKELALWSQDLLSYAMKVGKHYFGWIAGTISAGISFFATGPTSWPWRIIAVGGILSSCFQAWRDERNARKIEMADYQGKLSVKENENLILIQRLDDREEKRKKREISEQIKQKLGDWLDKGRLLMLDCEQNTPSSGENVLAWVKEIEDYLGQVKGPYRARFRNEIGIEPQLNHGHFHGNCQNGWSILYKRSARLNEFLAEQTEMEQCETPTLSS